MFKHLTTDPDSFVEVYRLTDQPWPSDPIYGEQPYGSADGRRLVVRHHEGEGTGFSMIDLQEETVQAVLREPRHRLHPAFHAWGRAVYLALPRADRMQLTRIPFDNPKPEPLCLLDGPEDPFSYGTVSQDGRWYAAVEKRPREDAFSRVWLWEIATGRGRVVWESQGYFCTHEQFSLDGRNRLLLQCNGSGGSDVRLGVLSFEVPDPPRMRWLAVSGEHTLPPSGHEAWMPGTDRIVFSTRMDEARNGNLWQVGLEDPRPRAVVNNHSYIGHVTLSPCGRFWLGDGYHEPTTPLYIGRLDTPKYRRLLDTHTGYRGKQVDHTHPYFTHDGRWIVFGSSRTGRPEVYAARLTEEFMASLASGGTPRERPQPIMSRPSGEPRDDQPPNRGRSAGSRDSSFGSGACVSPSRRERM